MAQYDQKMTKKYWFVEVDEIILLLIGIIVFAFSCLEKYQLYFIGVIIIWYWFKLRYYESKICKKRQILYNREIDCHYGQTGLKSIAEGKLEADKKPILYELEQLEGKRKFLIDKFVVINLTLLILIEIFIRK